MCMCISGKWRCVWERSAPPSASIEQTPDRALSRMAVRMSGPRKRSKSSVPLCPNCQGIYCPHDEWGKRIKRTGWREERHWDRRERGETTDKGYAEMKGVAKGSKEIESRMAKHGWRKRECKNERWETNGEKSDLKETEMKRKRG